jgi:hypothetical protein
MKTLIVVFLVVWSSAATARDYYLCVGDRLTWFWFESHKAQWEPTPGEHDGHKWVIRADGEDAVATIVEVGDSDETFTCVQGLYAAFMACKGFGAFYFEKASHRFQASSLSPLSDLGPGKDQKPERFIGGVWLEIGTCTELAPPK